jgi:hypothetical protein
VSCNDAHFALGLALVWFFSDLAESKEESEDSILCKLIKYLTFFILFQSLLISEEPNNTEQELQSTTLLYASVLRAPMHANVD